VKIESEDTGGVSKSGGIRSVERVHVEEVVFSFLLWGRRRSAHSETRAQE